MEGWRRYGSIWKADRPALLAKFKARRPGHAAFEQRLAQYQRWAGRAGQGGADRGCSVLAQPWGLLPPYIQTSAAVALVGAAP